MSAAQYSIKAMMAIKLISNNLKRHIIKSLIILPIIKYDANIDHN